MSHATGGSDGGRREPDSGTGGRRRDAAERRVGSRRLAMTVRDDAGVSAEFEDAKIAAYRAFVDAAPGGSADGDPDTLLRAAAACLAVGEFEAVRRLVRSMAAGRANEDHGRSDDDSARVGDGRPSGGSEPRGLLEALYTAWSGESPGGTRAPTSHKNEPPDEAAYATLSRGADAAARVCATVHDTLGVRPDATRGRIRLRPRLSDGWTHLEVKRLRFGDAELWLRYEKSGRSHVFELEQRRGAMPVRAVFEPMLRGSALAAANVDGEPAALDARMYGRRLLVPVQVELDHMRRIELSVHS